MEIEQIKYFLLTWLYKGQQDLGQWDLGQWESSYNNLSF